MKRKEIVLSFIGIIVVSIFLITTITKNNKKYIMQDGITVALTLDGEKTTEFPTDKNYTVDIDCQNATGTWLVEDWKLSVNNITGNVICNIDFKTKTDDDKITNIVENEATEFEGGKKPNTSTYTMLSQGDYSNCVHDSTEYVTFNTSTSKWQLVNTDSAEMTFYPPQDGYYQLCYEFADSNLQLQYYGINQTGPGSIPYDYWFLDRYKVESKCVNYGFLKTTDYIQLDLVGDSPNSTLYFKKITNISDKSSGFRYNGQTPNNYIWFNNEMWRIIGSIPTCMDSSCTSSQNLVKIIRDNPIGELEYSINDNNEWGSNSLYNLLNNYYYGALNGTDSGYCYSYYYSGSSSNVKSNCDYTINGILPDSYYGLMVEQVFWNSGPSINKYGAVQSYSSESQLLKQGYVGLMSASDFGYSGSSSYHNTALSSTSISNSSWLYSEGIERTMTPVIREGSLHTNYYYRGGPTYALLSYYSYGLVRPVVYLDPDVYVVSGDGTEANPYQVAM